MGPSLRNVSPIHIQPHKVTPIFLFLFGDVGGRAVEIKQTYC